MQAASQVTSSEALATSGKPDDKVSASSNGVARELDSGSSGDHERREGRLAACVGRMESATLRRPARTVGGCCLLACAFGD